MHYDNWLTSEALEQVCDHCEIHSYTYHVVNGCQHCKDEANDREYDSRKEK